MENDLFESFENPKVNQILKSVRKNLYDVLTPFRQTEQIYSEFIEEIPQNALDFLCLAWQHDHLSYQAKHNPSRSKQKEYHKKERDQCLDFAESLLGEDFENFRSSLFDKLGAVIRASSLVEMVNSRIRPYLNSCKG